MENQKKGTPTLKGKTFIKLNAAANKKKSVAKTTKNKTAKPIAKKLVKKAVKRTTTKKK